MTPPEDLDPRRSILVVEDEAFLREGIAELLAAAGWEVHQAGDGVEALEVFRARPIEVVLADLLMPRMDGIRLLRGVREVDPDVPCVVLTGYGTIDRCVEALRAGANDFLAKPFENRSLLEALDRAWAARARGAPPPAVAERSTCRWRFVAPAALLRDGENAAGAVAGVEAAARAAGYRRRRMAIRRALEEALANAVRHGARGAPGDREAEIVVEAVFDGARGVVSVTDPGPGFRPPEGLDPRPGAAGRGLFLIRAFADEARWIPPGNRVEMIFHRRGRPVDA